MKTHFTIALFWLGFSLLFAQEQDTRKAYNYSISRTNEPINVDGIADEIAWQHAPKIDHFMNHWPADQGEAEARSEVWTLYDEEYIYVLA
ncbi:MAG: hypothetical protein JJ909_14910, partial [Roseivirga sp.]|nr:hypothetical protein [Roseivirga sp.]